MKLAKLDAKILGFGKCGTRMCYDFFATSCGYPLSYELRMPGGSRIVRLKQILMGQARNFLTDLFGTHTVPLNATYGFFDSDKENEVAQSIATAEMNNERAAFAFPGQRHDFGDHESGCDYGIVAEAIAEKTPLPQAIAGNGATFRLWFSSLAGGTGSGSTLVFLRKDRRINRVAATHHLVVGVLPAEDLATINGSDFMEPERDDAINAGRFLVRWLAAASTPLDRGDGLLLLSNSATAFLDPNSSKDVFRPEALLNTFAARTFFHMAHANSADAQCHPDFDPTEMSNAFSGGLLLAGAGLCEAEEGDDSVQCSNARRLVKEALGNPKLRMIPGADERVVGMSVPLRDAELKPMLAAIDSGSIIETLPIEYKQATRVVVLCALSSTKGHSTRKREVEGVLRRVFDNSDVKFHFMLSRTGYDQITVVVVNPFLRQVQRLIYGYITHSWRNSAVDSSRLGEHLDEYLLGNSPKTDEILKLIREVEDSTSTLLGDRTVQLLAQNPPKLVDRDELERALLSLRGMLNWRRARVPPTRI